MEELPDGALVHLYLFHAEIITAGVDCAGEARAIYTRLDEELAKMKIGLGGLHIESCTFSPLLSGEKDFKLLRGQALIDSYPFLASEADLIALPLVYARALPGGPIEAGFYQRFKAEFLQMLADNAPFDGLFLHMHGAVSVAGMEDAEGDFLSAVRASVGKDCLIAASYDLHGNLSARVMDCIDFLSAYRTAPHVDWYETLERVFAILMRCLRSKLRPQKTYIPVPLLFAGEKTSTEWQPAASLYQQIAGVIDGADVLDASILIGYVWADEPRSSASVVAFGTQAEKVHAAAARLARQVWAARSQFQFGVVADSVDGCIQRAGQASQHPVLISDSGDNPTAGGAGDSPFVLARLLALGVRDAVFASIADASAVQRCAEAGAGGVVELSLGGKLDPVHASPLRVTAQVRAVYEVPWTTSRINDPGVRNRIAVVEVQGVRVILTQRRTPFHRIQDFSELGIDPYQAKIIVVKIGYLEPELRQLAAEAFLALSPGAVDQDMQRMGYQKLAHPLYPFDGDFEWSPG
jgi:microcystin degradation protein MlrC